jgi:hypothetical protein
MEKYRIVEKKFADDTTKFVPQHKTEGLNGESRWNMVFDSKNDEGYDNIELARNKIRDRKLFLLSQIVVEEIIHEIE